MKCLVILSVLCALHITIGADKEVFNTTPRPIKSNFSCVGRQAGFFADIEANCSIYHTCDDHGNKFTYHCPEETAFRQEAMICDHAHLVDCAKGTRLLSLTKSNLPFHQSTIATTRNQEFADSKSQNVNRTFSSSFHVTSRPLDLYATRKQSTSTTKFPPFIFNTRTSTRNSDAKRNFSSFHDNKPSGTSVIMPPTSGFHFQTYSSKMEESHSKHSSSSVFDSAVHYFGPANSNAGSSDPFQNLTSSFRRTEMTSSKSSNSSRGTSQGSFLSFGNVAQNPYNNRVPAHFNNYQSHSTSQNRSRTFSQSQNFNMTYSQQRGNSVGQFPRHDFHNVPLPALTTPDTNEKISTGAFASQFHFPNGNFPYSETLRSMQLRLSLGSSTTTTTTSANPLPVDAVIASLKPLVPNELEYDPYYPKLPTSTEAYYTPKESSGGFRANLFSTEKPITEARFEIPAVLPDLNKLEDLVDRRKLFYIPRTKSV